MSRHYQESEIEFRREDCSGEYPHARGLVIHQYGGCMEECVSKARKEFKLDPSEWKVVRFEDAEV